MEQRLKDLELLLEAEIKSARDHFRVGLESEVLSRRQASDVHTSEVSRLATAMETFGLRLAEETEAREVEDRSLRECMEDLVEALKENMAKFSTDISNVEIRMRDEISKVPVRSEQQLAETINGQLLSVLHALEEKMREAMSLEHSSIRDTHRSTLDAFDQRLEREFARISAEQGEQRNKHRTSMHEFETRLREDIRVRHQPATLPNDNFAADRAVLDALELKWQTESERMSNSHNNDIELFRSMLSEHRNDFISQRDTYRSNFEKLGQEIAGISGVVEEERTRQRLNIEEMEVKIRAELSRTLAEARAEEKLRSELSRTCAETRADLNEVRDANTALHERLRSMNQQNGGEQMAVEALAKRTRELEDRLHADQRVALDEHRTACRVALEAAESRLREEWLVIRDAVRSQGVAATHDDVSRVASDMKSDHELHRENVRTALNELREEVDRLAGLGQERNDSLNRLILAKQDEIQHKETLHLLEAKLMKEIESRHGQLTSAQRLSIESLDAELRGELSRLGRSGGDVSSEHKTHLQDMEARLKAEIDSRHSRLDVDHRSALESLDAILREEVARVEAMSLRSSTERQRDHSALRDLVEDLRTRSGQAETMHIEAIDAKLIDEVSRLSEEIKRVQIEAQSGINDRRYSDLKIALEDLDTRLNSRMDSLQRASLQALEEDLREELIRVRSESSKSHSTLRELLSNHQSDIDASHSRINSTNRAAMAETDSKLEELGAKCAKIESMQRSAIQALGDELRDEMVRSQQRNRGGPAFEDMEARVESRLRRTTETLERMLRDEIGRLDEEHRSQHGILEELRLKYQHDVDELRLPSCEDRQLLKRDEDDVERALSSLVQGISCEDAEGRQWHFHHPRDCLQHMSLRLKELRVAVQREQTLREASTRDIDVVTSSNAGHILKVEKEVTRDEEELVGLSTRVKRGEEREQSRAEQNRAEFRSTAANLRSEQSHIRSVERELDWREHEDAQDIPRIVVRNDASIGGLSSLPSSNSSITTPLANNTPVRSSRLTAPTQQMQSSRSSTAVPNSTRSVSPSQRSMQSSRSATAVGGGHSIVAGPAKSTRTASPKPSGPASRLQSRTGTSSNRPNSSPQPSRPNPTLKGSMRVRPAS